MAQNDGEVKLEVGTVASQFAWIDYADVSDEERIMIKEQALTEGFTRMDEVESCLQSAFTGSTIVDEDSFGDIFLGKEQLTKCLRDYQNMKEQHGKFSVSVGVAGVTGAGKTALLNALLGYPELLPTSNHEAATAVPCVISYNRDDTPDREFRGRVTFRDRADIARQLDEFFGDLKAKNQLESALEVESDQQTQADMEALRDAKANLVPTLEMINVLWGITEKDLDTMDAKAVIARDLHITKLCGKTKEFFHNDKDKFAESMKSYMDSTASQHTKSGSEFAAWPLVSLVEVFVKADILQNGVQLVDLPGLGDAVESRAAIAEKYFNMLAATLIVAPARRAADDTTSVKLMSRNQELKLQMNGKYHKQSYCVVLSQIDQIDVTSALRQKEAKSNHQLQDMVRAKQELETELKDLEKDSKKIAKEKKAAESAFSKSHRQWRTRVNEKNPDSRAKEAARVKRSDDLKKKREIKQRSLGISDMRRKKTNERDRVDCIINFLCIRERNRILKERLALDFKKRQAQVATAELNPDYDGTISILPVSSAAFWKCLCDGRNLPGFPTVTHTGIRQLSRWIRNSTIRERELHASSMLNSLHTIYNSLSTWSSDGWDSKRIDISSDWAAKNVFEPAVEKLGEKIQQCLEKLNRKVQGHNPLKNRRGSLQKCKKECEKVVVGWGYKNPENDATKDKIHWLTYQANIARFGRKFVPKSKEGLEFNWLEDIGDVLLKTIVKDWNRALHNDIPGLAGPVNEELNRIWNDSIVELQITVERLIPQLLPIMKEEIPKLDAIKKTLKDRAGRALCQISKNASNVHPQFIDAIRKRWAPTFKAALKEKGVGHFERRKDILFQFTQKSGLKMFNAAFERLDDVLRGNLEKLPADFSKMSELAEKDLTTQTKVLLNNVLKPDTKHEESVAQKLTLQRDIRTIVTKWEVGWKFTEVSYEPPKPDEVAMPTEYIAEEKDPGKEGESDSGEEVDSDEEEDEDDEDEEMDD